MDVRPLTKNTVRAFSLVELLVVISIFSMISLLILANHAKFNSSVLLGSLAYNIGLSIREAQVYGLSVKQFNTNFKVGYGVRFEGASTYTFFADTNANKKYNSTGNPPDSVVTTFSVGQGHTISKFCGITASGNPECSDGSTAVTIAHLDIVFYRPDPDANITSDQPTVYSTAEITVASPSGETRTVTVASTGQISVNQN